MISMIKKGISHFTGRHLSKNDLEFNELLKEYIECGISHYNVEDDYSTYHVDFNSSPFYDTMISTGILPKITFYLDASHQHQGRFYITRENIKLLEIEMDKLDKMEEDKNYKIMLERESEILKELKK